MRRLISMLFVVTSLLLVTQIGNAEPWDRQFESVSLPSARFDLSANQDRAVQLPSWRYVQRILVTASAAAPASSFSVWVNGEQRTTVNPQSSRVTSIDLYEATSLIEFKGLAGHVSIEDVTVIESTDTVANGGTSDGSFINFDEAQHLCQHAMNLTEQLRPYTNYANYGTFLLPIRKAAARAYATSSVHPGLRELARSLGDLEAQIESADMFLNEAFEVDASFNLSIELLTLKMQINEMLR